MKCSMKIAQTMRQLRERIREQQDPRKMIEFSAELNAAFAEQQVQNPPEAAPAKAEGAAAPIPKPPRQRRIASTAG